MTEPIHTDAPFELTGEQRLKLATLQNYIKALGAAAVCFSGGTDSTLVLAITQEQLPGRVVAITETNALYPQRESDEAAAFCQAHGIPQIVLKHDPQQVEGFAANPRNRCYLCKTDLFQRVRAAADGYAQETGLIASGEHLACLEGSNVSDRSDFRPGAQAVAEQGILSPLDAAGMTKQDVRDISRHLGLPTWAKPSFACLASRFAYGDTITTELLARVDAAEQQLLDAGFAQVRVRMHDQGKLARIEVTPDRLEDAFAYLQKGGSVRLHDLGFAHVSLDADGYRSGSMNE